MYRELASKSVKTQKYHEKKQKRKNCFISKFMEFTNENDAGVLLDFAVCQLTMNIPDYSQAYKYLKKALKLDPDSIGIQQFLAIVLHRGLGCVQEENKAFEILFYSDRATFTI